MLNKIRFMLQVQGFSNFANFSVLLLRVVVGLAFMIHGFSKIQNPFAWMDPWLGPQAPVGILQALAALSEFGGGLAWILGLLTPLASLGIASTMAVAVASHVAKGDAFVSSPGQASFELAAVYFAIALLFMMVGPGKFALDHKFFGNR